MKKTKLLTPIIGVAAIGATIAPIVATTSCTPTESMIIDTNVKKEKKVYLNASEETTAQARISGFKFNNKREGFGLNVKVINQSFSSADITASFEITSEDELEFDVVLSEDIITTTQTITFDLLFTNARGHSFTSTGYSLTNKVINWVGREKAGAFAEVDGKDCFFDLEIFSKIGAPITDIDHKVSVARNKFNSEIIFNPVIDQVRIGQGFLSDCTSFNQPFDLSRIKDIPIGFMQNCESFNQPLDVTGIVLISPSFMVNCKSFNQDLHFKNLLTFNLKGFMCGCEAMTSTINFGDRIAIPQENWDPFLVVTNEDCDAYNTGVTIICNVKEAADDYREAFPDLDGVDHGDVDWYRHLIFPELEE